MQRRGKSSRKATIAVNLPVDVKRRQLGWYLRNCAMGPDVAWQREGW